MSLRHHLGSFLIVAGIASSAAHSAPIIGGESVASTDSSGNSTVALLTLMPQGVGTCTGSLISEDALVTAAHCVSDIFGESSLPQNVVIIFDVDIEAGLKNFKRASSVTAHSGYGGIFSRGKNQNDIAVVRFTGGLPAGYRAAELLPDPQDLSVGKSTLLLGYGVTEQDPEKGGAGAGKLRKVEVKIHDPVFAESEVLLDQTEGRGACHGDSGGPAIVQVGQKAYLWGVTSRGYPETAPDDCKHFSVYTRIGAHQKFIEEALTVSP